MQTIIHVTDEDIAHGKVMSCTECPIARAATRSFHLPHRGMVAVSDELVWLDKQGRQHFWKLPGEAIDFILDFDSGHPVRPFSFAVTTSE